MEYISEQPIMKNGRLLSAIRFEKILPDRFLEVMENYKTNSVNLLVLSISKNEIASILYNPFSEEERALFAGFICRSYILMEFLSDLLKRAEQLKKDNF